MNIHISDHAYAILTQAARLRGTTLEALIESLAAQLPIGFAKDEDEFYWAMGMDDALNRRHQARRSAFARRSPMITK